MHPRHIPNSPGANIILGGRATFLKNAERPPTSKEFRKGVLLRFSNKPQDEEESFIKMVVVDMSEEEAATQLSQTKGKAKGS